MTLSTFAPKLMSGLTADDLLLESRDNHDWDTVVFLSLNYTDLKKIELAYCAIKDKLTSP